MCQNRFLWVCLLLLQAAIGRATIVTNGFDSDWRLHQEQAIAQRTNVINALARTIGNPMLPSAGIGEDVFFMPKTESFVPLADGRFTPTDLNSFNSASGGGAPVTSYVSLPASIDFWNEAEALGGQNKAVLVVGLAAAGLLILSVGGYYVIATALRQQ